MYFQRKAWADGRICLEWLCDFIEWTKDIKGEIMLGLDNLGGQKLHQFRKLCRSVSVVPVYTPPDCMM